VKFLSKKYIKLIIIFVFTFFAFYSCYTSQTTATQSKNKNLAYLYNPNSQTFHPDFKVIHISDDKSKLIIRLLKKELYFIKSPASSNLFTDIKIKYKTVYLNKYRALADTATRIYNFKKNLLKDTIDIELVMNLKKDSLYYTKIQITDLNRERKETEYVFID
jgi:hypothetical protein